VFVELDWSIVEICNAVECHLTANGLAYQKTSVAQSVLDAKTTMAQIDDLENIGLKMTVQTVHAAMTSEHIVKSIYAKVNVIILKKWKDNVAPFVMHPQ
jgi:hypothetical protein